MEYLFSRVPTADIPRSSFNRTHGHKTTFNAGFLIPFFCDEVLPGDTFALNAHLFGRLATPIVPIMDNLHMETFFFFVPNRLVWANWQRFMGERANPDDSIDYRIPVVNAGPTGFVANSIYDYLGLPIGVADIDVNALPLRAYNLIWNEWFRDQNLQDRVYQEYDDGPDEVGEYNTLRRGKRHDYFTSCLPWPQKGPGVELPLGASAPVVPNTGAGPIFSAGAVGGMVPHAGNTGTPGPNSSNVWVNNTDGNDNPLLWDSSGLHVDLSSATSATINSLRQAFQVQKLLERDARGGTRYTELLRSHFGVISPDARLQRPEYLGGGSIPIVVNPVVQTSATQTSGTATPQGNLAAYGVIGGKSSGFHKSFVEHGYILGLVMVRADLNYQSGLHRMWSRQTRYDFYWPAFAHLGEQTVLNKEIFDTSPSTLDPATNLPLRDSVFGYQERWAEYRYFPSKITGEFRSSYPQSLDIWHLAQSFGATPQLNASFIEDHTDDVINRVIAVDNEIQILFDSHIQINCVRPMPTYSVPGLIDHF